MVFSASSVAFAVEPVDQEHNEVLMDIQGGKLYAVADGLKTVAILTNDEEHLLDVSITYSDQPNTSYQWVLTDYPETFDYTQASFWSGVIENVNSRLSEANVYHITETVCDEPVETYSLDSSTGADFKEQMEDLLGTAEYYDRQKYMTSYQGKSFRVYDNMQFRIREQNSEVVEIRYAGVLTYHWNFGVGNYSAFDCGDLRHSQHCGIRGNNAPRYGRNIYLSLPCYELSLCNNGNGDLSV